MTEQETQMNQPLTKRNLVEKGIEALDLTNAGSMPVQHQPTGGVSRVDIAQVIELGKIMAASQDAVPQHCRGNVGICVRVCFQAVEWAMSPFQVADQTYVVNNRLAYMSQILHAVIEGRAPLRNRLDCEYEGEGPEMKCTVRGVFKTGDVREYESPMVKDIKVKNSPLWTADVKQQLFYYASRAWARKWCPDVLMGTYTREELLAQPDLGREEEPEAPGLHARLAGSERRSAEGHRDGHAASELAQIAGAGQTIDHEPAPAKAEAARGGKKPPTAASGAAKAGKTPSARLKPKAEPSKPDQPEPDPKPEPEKSGETATKSGGGIDVPVPRTMAQYHKYAAHWISQCEDNVSLGQRWTNERSLRNDLGMTAEDRKPLEDLIAAQRKKLAS